MSDGVRPRIGVLAIQGDYAAHAAALSDSDADSVEVRKPEQLADILEFICSEKGMPLRESVYKVYNNA